MIEAIAMAVAGSLLQLVAPVATLMRRRDRPDVETIGPALERAFPLPADDGGFRALLSALDAVP